MWEWSVYPRPFHILLPGTFHAYGLVSKMLFIVKMHHTVDSEMPTPPANASENLYAIKHT